MTDLLIRNTSGKLSKTTLKTKWAMLLCSWSTTAVPCPLCSSGDHPPSCTYCTQAVLFEPETPNHTLQISHLRIIKAAAMSACTSASRPSLFSNLQLGLEWRGAVACSSSSSSSSSSRTDTRRRCKLCPISSKYTTPTSGCSSFSPPARLLQIIF